MNEPKTKIMTISLPAQYADKIREQAENENRSISATIRMALDQMWRTKGGKDGNE